MALQLWMPLMGDLRNQGLSNFDITTLGTISWVNGKLGAKALQAGNANQTTNGVSINSNLTDLLSEEYSISVWVKPLGNHVHYNGTILSSGDWNHTRWAFGVNQDNTKVDMLSNGYNIYVNCTIPVNEWTHLVCTCNSSNQIHLYKNGEYITYITRSDKPQSDATNTTIGRETYAGGYFSFNGAIQDLRLYDHCLSPMEVKELSKGLILHYSLNRQGWGQENLAIGTDVASSTNGKVYNLSSTIPSGTKVTISCWIDADNVTMSGNQRIGLSSGITRTDSTGTQWFETWASYGNGLLSNNGSFHGRVSNTQTILGNMSSIGTYIQTLSSGTVSISQLKVEIGDGPTPWCPNLSDALATTMGLNSTTEYDCSGFCNNGTRTGTFSWTSDTPKYSVSQYFTDYTRYITTSLSGWTPSSITLSCWIKSTNKTPRGNWHIPLSLDGQKAEISIGTTGKARIGFTIGGTRYVYDWGNDILNGTWHLITNVFDGNSMKMYIDGVLINSSNVSGTLQSINNLYVGRFNGVDTYGNTQLYESDVRIYATALSADDVKSLYQNSAYIDSSGNVYGAVHSEV